MDRQGRERRTQCNTAALPKIPGQGGEGSHVTGAASHACEEEEHGHEQKMDRGLVPCDVLQPHGVSLREQAVSGEEHAAGKERRGLGTESIGHETADWTDTIETNVSNDCDGASLCLRVAEVASE